MEDDRPAEVLEEACRVLVGRARVDDDRLAQLLRQLELSRERAELRVARRVVAEVVEPDLADRAFSLPPSTP